MIMSLFFLILMPWFSLHIFHIGATITANDTVYVSKGKLTVLKCQVGRNSQFRWYRNNGRSGNRTYPITLGLKSLLLNKLKIVRNITDGEYNLQINNVTEEDEGVYDCLYGNITNRAVHLKFVTRVTLLILIKPKNLSIHGTVGGKLFGQEGKSLQLLCTITSGIPKETLTWYNMSSAIGKGGPGMLNITITPTRYDHYKTYTCQVSSASLQGLQLHKTVILEIKYYELKPLKKHGTALLTMGCIVGGILICSIASNIYCYLKRKPKANVMLQTYPEVHYDEIGTINYNTAVFEPTTNVTQENNGMPGISGDTNIPLGVESESSKESSLEKLTGFIQSGDGYENPYHSINPENIQMHPYSSIVSNMYKNTIIFPTTARTNKSIDSNIAEKTSKTPWLVIYTKMK